MATNVKAWSVAVNRRVAQNRAQFEQVFRGGGLYALGSVVRGTRRDTGRAAGNWQVELNDPPEGFIQGRAVPGGRNDGTITERVDPVTEGSRPIGRAKLGDVIWIHNGLPYISILENKDRTMRGTVEALRTWLRAQR